MINENIEKVKNYLEMGDCAFLLEDENEQIKALCVSKLCDVIGIECAYNYQNKMFQIFSSVTAEAVCQKLQIQKHIANDNIRLVKYNGINFVEKAKQFLDAFDIEEAILDIFNFIDEHKNLLLN